MSRVRSPGDAEQQADHHANGADEGAKAIHSFKHSTGACVQTTSKSGRAQLLASRLPGRNRGALLPHSSHLSMRRSYSKRRRSRAP